MPVATRRRMMRIRLGWALASAAAIALVLGARGGIAKADGDAPLVAAAPRPEVPAPPPPSPAEERAARDAAMAARLCDQPIAKIALNRNGTTIKFKVQLADGTRAQLRPSQASEAGYFRADVAAWRLARAL